MHVFPARDQSLYHKLEMRSISGMGGGDSSRILGHGGGGDGGVAVQQLASLQEHEAAGTHINATPPAVPVRTYTEAGTGGAADAMQSAPDTSVQRTPSARRMSRPWLTRNSDGTPVKIYGYTPPPVNMASIYEEVGRPQIIRSNSVGLLQPISLRLARPAPTADGLRADGGLQHQTQQPSSYRKPQILPKIKMSCKQHPDSRCVFAIRSQHLWCRGGFYPKTHPESSIKKFNSHFIY